MLNKNFADTKAALASRISGWYDNARMDYGVNGKFLDAKAYGDKGQHMRVTWEEQGKRFALNLSWWTEYSAEQLYNIWMEADDTEELPQAKPKGRAYSDYISMMKNSWTYNRMTQEEQKNIMSAFEFGSKALHGTYKQRYQTLQVLYYSFLCGLGYSGGAWREAPECSAQAPELDDEWADIDPAAIREELDRRNSKSDFVSQVMQDADRIASVQDDSLSSNVPQEEVNIMHRPKNKEERLEVRKSYLSGYDVTENTSADCTIATNENNGKYYLMVFDGTSARPCINCGYRTAAARQQEIDRHIKTRMERIQAKEAQKQAKNAKGAYVVDESKPHFVPGELYFMNYYNDDPWEHTATIRIIKRTACFVTFAHVYGEKEEKPQRAKVSVDQDGEYLSFGSFYYFRASSTVAEAPEEEPAMEDSVDMASSGREYIESVSASHPITEYKPVVTITWSECPAFGSWGEGELKLSVEAADIILQRYDETPTNGSSYYKTWFAIHYTDEGEEKTYTGRYDLGDHEGGLLAYLRRYNPAVADALEGFNTPVKVTLAPWAIGALVDIVEQNRAKREDMLDMVEILTDEQLISAVFNTAPANQDVARFFLQQLAQRDQKKAIEVFRAWRDGRSV